MKRRVFLLVGGAFVAAAAIPSLIPNRLDDPANVTEAPLLTDPDGDAFVYRNGWIERV